MQEKRYSLEPKPEIPPTEINPYLYAAQHNKRIRPANPEEGGATKQDEIQFTLLPNTLDSQKGRTGSGMSNSNVIEMMKINRTNQ